MSLFVDRSAGVDSGSVTTDLFTISWNDGNLGQGADTTITGVLGGITSIPVAPVTYTPAVTTGMATADRLFEVVNKKAADGLHWAFPIVITPLPGGIDPYSGEDITGNGLTYVDTGPTPNVIHIAYDTSQANGQGLALFDKDGNAIQTPNAVILYHEMSHAFHEAINQIPFPQSDCPGNTSDEPAAEIDENVLRTQLGLCLRDVCNHNGETGFGKACGGRATPDGPPLVDGNAPPEDTGCFIVTAATGSPQATEIIRLRAMRDRLAARSAIARDLIAAVYDEYWRFSPQIALAVAATPAARAAVRQFVVGPLFAWFELAEALALDGDVERALGGVAAACPAELAPQTALVLNLAAAGGSPPPGLEALSGALRQAAARPLAAWALLRPLLEVWACAAQGTRRGAGAGRRGRRVAGGGAAPGDPGADDGPRPRARRARRLPRLRTRGAAGAGGPARRDLAFGGPRRGALRVPLKAEKEPETPCLLQTG
jgi:hypothetical protein